MSIGINLPRSGVWLAHACLTLSLVACGGGSSSPDSGAAPSGGDPKPVTPGAQAQASRYYAAVANQTDQATKRNESTLLIVDTTDDKAVRQVKLTGYPSAVTHIVNQASLDVENKTLSSSGHRSVYYIQGGKIFRQDLIADTLPNPVQVSNVQGACAFYGSNSYSTDAETLQIGTSGLDGNCDTEEDNGTLEVASTMSATDAPLPSHLTAVNAIYKQISKLDALALLVHDKGSNKLFAYSLNLQKKLYEIATPPEVLSTDSYLDVINNIQTDAQYIQIDNRLYTTQIIGTELRIGSLIQSSNGHTEFDQLAEQIDHTLVLFPNGRIEAVQGADKVTRHIATLPAGSDPVVDWHRQGDNIIIATRNTTTSNETYFKLNLINGALTSFGNYTHNAKDSSSFLNGDHLNILRRGATPTSPMSLIKYSLKTSLEQVIVSNLIAVGHLAAFQGFDMRLSHIVYCKPLETRTDCAGAMLRVRNLDTGAEVDVGNYPAAAPGVITSAYVPDPFADPDHVVLYSWAPTSNTAAQTSVWAFSRSKANSMTQLQVAP